MLIEQPFSKRNRLGTAKEITIRNAAPESLRYFVLDIARQLEYAPSSLRTILCRTLRKRPDPGNWSEYPNIWGEVQDLIYGCEWYEVYDIIEAVHSYFARNDANNGQQDAATLTTAINEFFSDEGIGWQLIQGQIVTRGNEPFEAIVKEATHTLSASARRTAASHLHDALQLLSRRPNPDSAGAIYHSMGSLECVARDVTGDAKATLGEIIKRHPDLLPKPLDAALSQIWGYASNEARHVQEGHDPSRDDAELIVGISAALSEYIIRKSKNPD